MIAYKCDICGAYFTKRAYIKVNNIHKQIGRGGMWNDICPDCIKAIQTVIDEREELKL